MFVTTFSTPKYCRLRGVKLDNQPIERSDSFAGAYPKQKLGISANRRHSATGHTWLDKGKPEKTRGHVGGIFRGFCTIANGDDHCLFEFYRRGTAPDNANPNIWTMDDIVDRLISGDSWLFPASGLF